MKYTNKYNNRDLCVLAFSLAECNNRFLRRRSRNYLEIVVIALYLSLYRCRRLIRNRRIFLMDYSSGWQGNSSADLSDPS